jgi:hypothetical protein
VALFAFGGGIAAAQTAAKPVAKKSAAVAVKPRPPVAIAKPAARPGTAVKGTGAATKAPARTATRRPASSATKGRTQTAGTASRSRTRAAQKRAPVRRAQMAPTLDRYKEIQQALADKGYYQGTVSGAWGPESGDALKRFQKDQNLNETGKLDSLSLIALGLGPKRNLSSRSTTESRPKDDNRRPEGSERP